MALLLECNPPLNVLKHTVDKVSVKLYGLRSVCECFCVSLTGCHSLRAVVVAVVVLQAEEGGHAGAGAQALSQVGGCWVVGMHLAPKFRLNY